MSLYGRRFRRSGPSWASSSLTMGRERRFRTGSARGRRQPRVENRSRPTDVYQCHPYGVRETMSAPTRTFPLAVAGFTAVTVAMLMAFSRVGGGAHHPGCHHRAGAGAGRHRRRERHRGVRRGVLLGCGGGVRAPEGRLVRHLGLRRRQVVLALVRGGELGHDRARGGGARWSTTRAGSPTTSCSRCSSRSPTTRPSSTGRGRTWGRSIVRRCSTGTPPSGRRPSATSRRSGMPSCTGARS